MSKAIYFLVYFLLLISTVSLSAQDIKGIVEPEYGYKTVKNYTLVASGEIHRIASKTETAELLTILLKGKKDFLPYNPDK